MKNYENLEIMESFDENNLPSLKTTVLWALELFIKKWLPNITFRDFKYPLIVWSWNAIVTWKILFEKKDAIFADENNYKNALKKNIDGVFLFSASGGKHAPIIAKEVMKHNLPIQVITCTKWSQVEELVWKDNVIVTFKNREPYTYNTSTYLGWILAKTRENPQQIKNFIEEKVKPYITTNFDDYNWFLLVTPNELASLNQLFIVKFIELFWRRVSRDVKSFEELKHAITVVPYEKELCIKFGRWNIDFGNDILDIPIPENCGIGMLMSIVYYVIGCIQEQHPQYFKDNIKNYIKRNAKWEFGKALSVIVE